MFRLSKNWIYYAKILVALIAACSTGIWSWGSLTSSAQTKSVKDPPTVDFITASLQNKSNVRKHRDAFYIDTAPNGSPIAELPIGVEPLPTDIHFWIGLNAIPTEQSDVIVVAQVKSAAAHLTDNYSGIYSEFSILIGEIFKGSNNEIRTGQIIDVDRAGGCVRFPSGKIQKYTVGRQGTPEMDSTYVFFLKQEKDSLMILTAYDLSHNRITPLDGEDTVEAKSNLPFAKYRDALKSDFLADLKNSLMNNKVDSK